MPHRPHRCVRVLALAALLGLAACGATPRQAGTPIDAATARSTFEQVWSTVESGDSDPAHGGVDWKGVKAEFEPRAEACTTREQLRQVLDEMLARLGRSHFGVLPHRSQPSATDVPASAAPAGEPGTLGLTLRRFGDVIVVTDVREGLPAAQAGVQAGWTVDCVNGAPALSDAVTTGPMARYARDAAAQSLDHGTAGSGERWVFIDAKGARHERALQRTPVQGTVTQLGALPPLSVECRDRRLSSAELVALGVPSDLRVAVIAFNIWMPVIAADLDAAVDRHRDADGIVLDLRGNPGGVGAMSMGVAGHFHDAADSLGTMRARDATLEFRVNPRRSTADGRQVKPFAGPLVILVDPLTASTSEIFAAGLQSLGRAHVVGRASAGAALPAQMRELPSGDALMFAFADFTTPDGRHLEGQGVQPDEVTGADAASWASGVDPDLQAAARFISKTLRDRDCH